MNVTDIFVKRPVLATVVSLLILVIGLRSLALLELREYPSTHSTVVTVSTFYPGADAGLVQSFITQPLQRAVAEADGIDYVTSSSTQGVSVIEARMHLNYDPNAAIAEIQAKVASQRNVLPEEAEDPVISSSTGDSFALMYLAFFSDQMNTAQITDYVLRVVQPKLQAVPGLAKATVSGDQTFAMRIWLDPDRMAALGVTASDVRTALQRNNFLAGVGQTKGDAVAINLTVTTDITTEEAFRDLVVRTDGPTLIRLSDVAEVKLDSRSYDLAAWYNGNPAIMMGMETTPGANPLTVSAAVHEILPEIERQLPSGLQMAMPHDASEYITDAISEVFQTLAEAILIVLLIIFLSLGNWHAAIVPAVSVPLSLVGAAFIMLMFGFSINLLTLLAMLLAIGLVVDDAIVVVENVHRHVAEGQPPFMAALLGARELALPIFSMTTTLMAVYAPIGFMTGLIGVMFTEFAFALAGAVVISGIVALTLSPMLSSKVLQTNETPGRFEKAVEDFFEKLAHRYNTALTEVLKYRNAVLVFSVGVLASIYFMFVTSQSELAPTEDRSLLNVQAVGPSTATLEYASAYAHQIIGIYETFPEYLRSFLTVGAGGTPATSRGGFRVVPVDQRDRSQNTIHRELQAKLANVAGVQAAVFTWPSLPGVSSGPPLQFVITTDQNYEQLNAMTDQMVAAARQSGLFMFAAKSVQMDLPTTSIVIDRDRAGDLGIPMSEVGTSLATMLGGNNVNRFSLAGRSYEVVPQVARSFRRNEDGLNNYYVRASSGELVPMSAFSHFEHKVEPTKRTQHQQLNAVTINGVMRPGVSLGDAVAFMESKAAELFPREYSYDYTGESRQFKQQGSALMLTFFLSLLVIYLVLAAQFESWRDPLIILMSVPMSIAGALIFVTLGAATINIYTQVGLITLIGLIAKNGILIVDFANRLRRQEGMDKLQAVIRASTVRLRPILMTTVAMMMAMVPLLIASGPGAVSRFQIGLVIVAGLGIGTLFTLFVVPSFYLILSGEQRTSQPAAP